MSATKKPISWETPTAADGAQQQQLFAHDIRAALGGVLGGLSLIADENLSADDRVHFSRANASAKMLLGLLDGANTGVAMPVDVGWVNPAAAIEQLQDRWLGEVIEKGINLNFSWDKTQITAPQISALDFQRVFNNIIGNAVKFTSSGEISVAFGVDTKNRFYGIIQDSGPGFSSSALENLFTFQNRSESANKAGSGMGLFIVKHLVDTADGEIHVENDIRGGAKVSVILPVAAVSAPVAMKQTAKKNDLPDLSHLKILMAEDNLTNQMVVTQMLRAMGADCVIASDGVEAMERFEEQEFDIALIDIEMPRMSGLEVMRSIRGRNDAKAVTPLVALTAYVLPEHQDRINAAGANGLIAKPLTNIGDFGRSILSYVDKSPVETNVETAVSEVSNEDYIDMAIYDGLAEMIGAESMLELLGKVKTDIENVKQGISDGMRDKSGEAIGSNTHILISVAGAIGAVDLQNAAQSLNTLAKTSNWDDIETGSNICIKGCDQVLSFVESQI
ncbi:MAG: response regulator [Rhodobacteraceae bacterium]|nr:response regulator [Paracoccaceae bacterium]